MPRVQISAQYLIHWPKHCACCMGPAETTVEASAVRVTGKKIVKRDERGWLIPYCHGCVNHHRLSEQIRRDRESGGDEWDAPLLMRLGGFGLLALALLLTCAGIGGTAVKPPPGWTLPQIIVLTLALACFSAAGGIGLLISAAYRSAEDAADASDREEQERARMARLRAALAQCLTGTCACEGVAVIYEGWYGTLHTFEFRSARYAEAFCRANASKIV